MSEIVVAYQLKNYTSIYLVMRVCVCVRVSQGSCEPLYYKGN